MSTTRLIQPAVVRTGDAGEIRLTQPSHTDRRPVRDAHRGLEIFRLVDQTERQWWVTCGVRFPSLADAKNGIDGLLDARRLLARDRDVDMALHAAARENVHVACVYVDRYVARTEDGEDLTAEFERPSNALLDWAERTQPEFGS